MAAETPADRGRRLGTNLALLLVTSILLLLASEGVLRLAGFLPAADRHYIWAPHFSITYWPAAEVFPGVHGPSHVRTSSLGLRGGELTDADLRILTIGGSTTENLFLDQDETWQALLEERLAAAWPDRRVWVGNAGRSGHTTREHVVQARYLLDEIPEIDVVILLIGINDLGLRLRQQERYDPQELERPDARIAVMDRAFTLYPDKALPWYRRTALFQAARRLWWRVSTPDPDTIDPAGRVYDHWRELRAKARIRSELPDLTAALAEYERNVEEIIDLAEQHGVRPVFLTQPTTWRPGLPAEIARLATQGRGPSSNEYYSIEALSEGMDLFNQRLLEVCERRRVDCLDMASLLPKDTTVFFDDCHYNEGGARRFAEVLAAHLEEQPELARLESAKDP